MPRNLCIHIYIHIDWLDRISFSSMVKLHSLPDNNIFKRKAFVLNIYISSLDTDEQSMYVTCKAI